MTALVRYEAARAALQAAVEVDEVKDIRDKALAMAAYAQQAKDTKLLEWASDIKVRAERKAGEMLAEMPKHNGGRPNRSTDTTGSPNTLADLGISKDQSSQWQKVAAIPEERFEKAVAQTKGDTGIITTAAVLRNASPKKADPAPRKAAKPEKKGVDVQGLKDYIASLTEQRNDLADTARELSDKLAAFENTKPDEQQREIMRLQKQVQKLEGEIERLTKARNDCQAKCNELIREVKRLRRG